VEKKKGGGKQDPKKEHSSVPSFIPEMNGRSEEEANGEGDGGERGGYDGSKGKGRDDYPVVSSPVQMDEETSLGGSGQVPLTSIMTSRPSDGHDPSRKDRFSKDQPKKEHSRNDQTGLDQMKKEGRGGKPISYDSPPKSSSIQREEGGGGGTSTTRESIFKTLSKRLSYLESQFTLEHRQQEAHDETLRALFDNIEQQFANLRKSHGQVMDKTAGFQDRLEELDRRCQDYEEMLGVLASQSFPRVCVHCLLSFSFEESGIFRRFSASWHFYPAVQGWVGKVLYDQLREWIDPALPDPPPRSSPEERVVRSTKGIVRWRMRMRAGF
ncbi:hypothetical protein BJ684DRAFT_18138, partial [Piptocephalis cylindrospora]